MASPPNGYREGERDVRKYSVDADTADIKTADFLIEATAGFVKVAAAGDTPLGVAMQDVDSPSADGDVDILVDISPHTTYEYPPDAGSVTQALVGRTMDVGGAQTIDIDASTDDVIRCVGVDTIANTLLCQLIPTNAGVV
ncbi:hypothetical protein LCGC14_3001610 [marine sediment metagenome]|uniref:Uncharacterized protein n=1 Tax=marine sediment metagenome TaxID=412755 RepID=A0A0F8XNG1_9ZZZZ